jgi:hypothetical protein
MKSSRLKRDDLLDWLQRHPGWVEDRADKALAAIEQEVRRYAREFAWHRAIDIAHERGEAWSHRSRGMHCPEDWAACEFCKELASDLRMLEPIPDEGSEEEFAGKSHLAQFVGEGRSRVMAWVHDVAAEEEHQAWLDVIRFTKERADSWIEEGTISTEERWDLTHSYTDAAVHASQLLERDYALQAHRRL